MPTSRADSMLLTTVRSQPIVFALLFCWRPSRSEDAIQVHGSLKYVIVTLGGKFSDVTARHRRGEGAVRSEPMACVQGPFQGYAQDSDDYISFPQLQRAAKDLMLDAPSAVDEHQLRALHLSWLTKAPQDVRRNET